MELTDSAPKEESVAPSPEETPTTEPEVTPEPTEPEIKKDEPALYDLPDGRKVDAATLTREWKDNFLPDYTRKSQRIADIDRGSERKDENIKTPDNGPNWKDPDYVPENYAEVIEIAKAEALAEMRAMGENESRRMTAIQSRVDAEVSALKASDPRLDENALFQHANKYGFQDLKAAHTNMTDMRKAALEVEQRTVKNIKAREADPVGGGAGGSVTPDEGYDPRAMSAFGSAADYLARLKGR